MKKMTEFEYRLKALQIEFEEYKKSKRILQTPEIGSTMEVSEMKWIVLDKLPDGYLMLAAESIGEKAFGSNNDWRESSVRTYLNADIASKIEEEIGTNLPELERNLLSLDGQTEYGTCLDKVSLITLDEYRKYRKYIPNAGYWWWTCTPDSTNVNGNTRWIRAVSSGGVFGNVIYGVSLGVRPVCIFPSSILESER